MAEFSPLPAPTEAPAPPPERLPRRAECRGGHAWVTPKPDAPALRCERCNFELSMGKISVVLFSEILTDIAKRNASREPDFRDALYSAVRAAIGIA